MKRIRLWLLMAASILLVSAALRGREELVVELFISIALLVGSEIEHP